MILPSPPRETLDRAALRPAPVEGLVRLGAPNDGGYVIPAALVPRTRVLISLGVSDDWSFESAFRGENATARIVAVDGSVGRAHFLGSLVVSWWKALFHLVILDTRRAQKHVRRLRAARDFFRFFRGENRFLRRWVAAAPGAGRVTLAELFAEHGGPAEAGEPGIFLKVDIEGAEFEVLDQVLPHAELVLAIAVEFHGIGARVAEFGALVGRLSREFALVHVHGNNFRPYLAEIDFPDAVELTFVHRRVLAELTPAPERALPVYGLDAPNDPRRPDHPLRFDAGRGTGGVR